MYELNEFEIIKKKYKENNKYENSENYIFKLEEQNEELINMLTIVCKMIDINKWYPGALKGIKPLLEKIKQKPIEEILKDAEGKLFKEEENSSISKE